MTDHPLTDDELAAARRYVRMIEEAATTYKFPPPDPGKVHDAASAHAYVTALIAHVAKRDWATAHELRLRKPQAEWTPAEVNDFHDGMRRIHSAHELKPGLHKFAGVDFGDGFPVTEATLRGMASDSLETLMAMRRDDLTKSLPILANVLFVDGRARLFLPSSDDRIGLLKMLARTSAVFGFALAFDAWMHQILLGDRASKRDAILQHLITRDLRLVVRRPYARVHCRAVFDDPPPPDLDGRAMGPDFEDPYAELFVTVPRTEGVS